MENNTIYKKCRSSSTVVLVLYFRINFVIIIGTRSLAACALSVFRFSPLPYFPRACF